MWAEKLRKTTLIKSEKEEKRKQSLAEKQGGEEQKEKPQ